MTHLITAIGIFLATHIVLAENPARGVLVRTLGERPFAWGYGAVAVLQLIWIGQAIEAAPVVRFWEPPAWAAAIPLLVMPLALLLLVCGFTQNNPTATLASGRLARREVMGILAVTRNPVMWGLGLWSLAHLAVVAEAAEALRYAAFAALPAAHRGQAAREVGRGGVGGFYGAVFQHTVRRDGAGPRAAQVARDRRRAPRRHCGALSRDPAVAASAHRRRSSVVS